jgi:hypothetical protein
VVKGRTPKAPTERPPRPPSARPPSTSRARSIRPPALTVAPVVILGPQRFDPTVAEAGRAVGITGPYVTVTAGWQEREHEDDELHKHFAEKTVNLRLYERAERVWKADPELRAAHRKRQERLRLKQDFYRIRLEHELEAARVIDQRKAPPEILEEERAASIVAIRDLDAYHLAQCAREKNEWTEKWRPLERPAVAKEREEIEDLVQNAGAVAIAGGHVATLLNRLELFGMGELLRGKPLLAWSAGAMAISDRVVLFHDSPPQGAGAAELLDRGLGLCPDVIPLPHPEQRLRLSDPVRTRLLSRRFAPALSLAMTSRSHITWNGLAFVRPYKIGRLLEDGSVEKLGWPPDSVKPSAPLDTDFHEPDTRPSLLKLEPGENG